MSAHQPAFPKISVITPCFNMTGYIEQTICSILDQGYPNLEYIIVDGGSTDGTLDVIGKYRDRISVIISEPDKGMYDAIQKGMNLASGEILAWLNADDVYLPWTFSVVAEIFSQFEQVDWIMGRPSNINAKGQFINFADTLSSFPRKIISNGWAHGSYAAHVQQESCFWRRSLWEKVGGLNNQLRYAGEYELWTRFAQYTELVEVDVPLASFRVHGEQQLSRNPRYVEEIVSVLQDKPAIPWLWQLCAKNVCATNIFRRLIRYKGKVIVYNRRTSRWELLTAFLPLGRNSFQKLYLTWKMRRSL